jgi:hypothetical protein
MLGNGRAGDNNFLVNAQDVGMGSGTAHKMLEKHTDLRWFFAILGRVAMVGVIAWVAVAAFSWNRDAVFFGGGVYFSDGDCYARMTRVRMIEEEGWRSIRSHGWENFPEGVVPHTTMPLDAVIAGLAAVLRAFTERPLEMAGAWVSPMLGWVTVGFLVVWGLAMRWPFWWAMGLVAAGSPMLAHGFQVGRPDHQSLLVLLIAVALAAEVGMWTRRGRGWPVVSGVAWGLALWVSLFEPGILLGVVLVARGVRVLVTRNAAAGPGAPPYHYGVLAGIFLLAVFVDGWRAGGFHEAFGRWALNIGELRSAGWDRIFSWCGWLAAVAPGLLIWRAFRGVGAVCGLFAGLIVVLTALCFWHARWGYFLALVFAMSLPWALAALRWKWLAAAVLAVSLWPVAAEWERILYPNDEVFRARAENVADAVSLREATGAIGENGGGAVLAPWWFSPAIVWWSGKPCVGGTSHQSLPGIVDSCGFYLATEDAEAREILRRRGVEWVFAYEPERAIGNSEQVLGRKSESGTMAERLYKKQPVEGLALVFENRFFKVYRVAF